MRRTRFRLALAGGTLLAYIHRSCALTRHISSVLCSALLGLLSVSHTDTAQKKMMTAARNTTGTPAAGRKKPRKPYTISRPREKWTADEHDRFLHSLLMFGRDWKTIEQFVGTKTATQIRSHAQKYFLKVHKLGLAAALPPPHPRRPAVLPEPPIGSCFLDSAETSLMAPATAAAQQSVDWPASCSASAGAARWPKPNHDGSFMATPNSSDEAPAGGGSPGEEARFAACLLQDDTVQLPLSPDDLRFAEVYRFFGDVFGSGASRPVEAQLQRLHGADPVVVETILLLLRNLQDNLCG